MRADLNTFCHNEDGATVIEYGLIVAVLSLAIIGGFGYAADAIAFLFSDNGSKMVQAFTR